MYLLHLILSTKATSSWRRAALTLLYLSFQIWLTEGARKGKYDKAGERHSQRLASSSS